MANLLLRNGVWFLAPHRDLERHKPPSKQHRDFSRNASHNERQKEWHRIHQEIYYDEGTQVSECGIPQKGEQVSRTNSPMFDIHPGEVLIRKRGPEVIYRHPNWTETHASPFPQGRSSPAESPYPYPRPSRSRPDFNSHTLD